jgi:glyoxylase-like metal-dependent hydrolase (beta-lactamase superfamily II)
MIPFQKEFTFDYGVAHNVSPLIRRVVAANPGRFTGPGTGTLIVGRGEVAVIDPGPASEAHFGALQHALEGERVSHVFVTHEHMDHSPLGRRLADAHGATLCGRSAPTTDEHGGDVREEAGDDLMFAPDLRLQDGLRINGRGWTIHALHTPGHTSEHFCFEVEEENTLLCGDHVMAWSTSIVSPPNGNMRDYMASLARVRAMDFSRLVPTHGTAIDDPAPFLDAYIVHRQMREQAVLDQVKQGVGYARDMVAALYADIDRALHPAAMRSIWAHLIHLHQQGKIVADPEPRIDAHYLAAAGNPGGCMREAGKRAPAGAGEVMS